jgi:hypothetical protein
MFLRNIGDTQLTTRPYIPEDGTPYNHRCEKLKSCNLLRVEESNVLL